MKKRIRRRSASVDHESFPTRTWTPRRHAQSVPVRRPSLSERMPSRVPPDSTTLAEGGRSFLTVTPLGVAIGWDVCGACSVHVIECRCTTPRAPRSVTYMWFQDDAYRRGERWSPEHPDYRRDFTAPEPETTSKVRRRGRKRS